MHRRLATTDHVILDYSHILPRVYLGTNACCQRHFDLRLLRKGVTADISLEAERIDAPRGVDYFLWLPTKDHTAPTLKDLDLGSQTIDWLLRRGECVYIHCKNGHGRASTLLAAYFIRDKHWPVDRAVAFIKRRRPEIHLEPAQRRRLIAFSRR